MPTSPNQVLFLITDVTQKNFFMKFIYCTIHRMNKQLLDLYSDYLISSFNQTTATGLSKLLDGSVSHDKISRFLAERKYTSKDLWKEVKSTIRQIESDTAVLIVDDTIFRKSHTVMKMSLFAGITIIAQVGL